MDISTQILSDITVHMKYARYLPEFQRRETWYELVTRNTKMHIKQYPKLEKEINKKNKKIRTINIVQKNKKTNKHTKKVRKIL